jgi:hypothetical protein
MLTCAVWSSKWSFSSGFSSKYFLRTLSMNIRKTSRQKQVARLVPYGRAGRLFCLPDVLVSYFWLWGTCRLDWSLNVSCLLSSSCKRSFLRTNHCDRFLVLCQTVTIISDVISSISTFFLLCPSSKLQYYKTTTTFWKLDSASDLVHVRDWLNQLTQQILCYLPPFCLKMEAESSFRNIVFL